MENILIIVRVHHGDKGLYGGRISGKIVLIDRAYLAKIAVGQLWDGYLREYERFYVFTPPG